MRLLIVALLFLLAVPVFAQDEEGEWVEEPQEVAEVVAPATLVPTMVPTPAPTATRQGGASCGSVSVAGRLIDGQECSRDTEIDAAYCAQPATMALRLTSEGLQIRASGFAPGSTVGIWLLSPAEQLDRSTGDLRIVRPRINPEITARAGSDCRIETYADAFVRRPGTYAVYLAGPRPNGGAELTMFQRIDLRPGP